MSGMKRILFVDDETKVLEGLRRMLSPLRREWDMHFATSGAEALELMAGAPFDVIVTDMRMPGMDGGELLGEVIKRHPEAVRLVLSGHSDGALTLKSAMTAHQHLSKPCDADTLKSAVTRAFRIRGLLEDASLLRLVSRLTTLPSIPSVYRELSQALQNPTTSPNDVAAIIKKDTAMSAKMLQLVNSAFFGLRQRITTPDQAVLYLGLDTVKALALSARVFAQFDTSRVPSFSIEALSNHSLATGLLAQRIVEAENQPSVASDAFLAGLLHDIGKLILVATLSEQYEMVLRLCQEDQIAECKAEREVFEVTHAEVGGYLLWLWGFDESIVEAVAFHHEPSRSSHSGLSALTAVHAANALEGERHGPCSDTTLDLDYLARLNLESRPPMWRAMLAGNGG